MDQLSFQEFGDGPVVVVLHGGPTTPEHMVPLARALGQSYRAIVVDMPGYGRSTALEGDYTLARAQDALEQTLLGQGITECAAVGFSLGGYRALSLAASGRLHVWAVASLGGFASLTAAERETYAALAAAFRAGAVTREAMPMRMLSPEFLAAHPEAAEETKTWVDAITKSLLAEELDATARCADLCPQLARLAHLQIPVLARVGALDIATPTTRSEQVVQVSKGVLNIVPHVGHALLLEDFQATLEAVRRILAEGSARRTKDDRTSC